MDKEIAANLCLAIVLFWGLYIGINSYKYFAKITKNRDHFNIQSVLSEKDRVEGKKVRNKMIISFLIVSVLLIGISVLASLSEAK